MEPCKTASLSALFVFRNLLQDEMVRSLHVYRREDGKEEELERAYAFWRGANSCYVEMAVGDPLLNLLRDVGGVSQPGRVIGFWLCIFSFRIDRPFCLNHIPSLLSLNRNQKLKSVPTLADDLHQIFQLSCGTNNPETVHKSQERISKHNRKTGIRSERALPVLDQDLNCLPYSVDTSELSQSAPGAQIEEEILAGDRAKIALKDLAKYFDYPIKEASIKLKIGLTALKKICRDFGILRWPHRKIKSLEGLIHILKEEVEHQQQEDEAAVSAVMKRQRMLESEKEAIERNPFTDLQKETKRFRQDVYKRRHKARVLNAQDPVILSSKHP